LANRHFDFYLYKISEHIIICESEFGAPTFYFNKDPRYPVEFESPPPSVLCTTAHFMIWSRNCCTVAAIW